MSNNQPTPAFIGASWSVMMIGVLAYCFGLWNAQMMLNEKGYYFAVLCLGLYSAISLQKTIRDRAEDIATSNLYYMISWTALIIAILLELVGLWNSSLSMSEKGFYLMAFTMSLFASITIQKNVRDMQQANSIPTLPHTPNKAIQPNGAKVPNPQSVEKNNILQSPFRRNKD